MSELEPLDFQIKFEMFGHVLEKSSFSKVKQKSDVSIIFATRC